MTTEQETGRGAPVRRATPKTGTRRLGAPHQSKPRPRPDVESKLSAAERARLDLDGKRSGAERVSAERAGAGGATRVRPDGRPEAGAGTGTGTGTGTRTGTGLGIGVKRIGSTGAQVRRPAPRRRQARMQRASFVLLVVGLLCGGLVSLLLLNTMLAKDAITDANLRDEIAVARQEKEKIELDYQLKTQPDVLATMAEGQGQHRNWDNVDSWSGAGTDGQSGQADRER
ncbi:hypothetical protein ACIBQ1_00980 [Nonomuraea sp. NPDC050153]|uniref:hypothetical protein n=1 Tax=Nonomuraea sp. NPDC050153 TaxID=3364359 RepID=UPI0037A8D608